MQSPIRYERMAINDYRDLEVWQVGRSLVLSVHEATRVDPAYGTRLQGRFTSR